MYSQLKTASPVGSTATWGLHPHPPAPPGSTMVWIGLRAPPAVRARALTVVAPLVSGGRVTWRFQAKTALPWASTPTWGERPYARFWNGLSAPAAVRARAWMVR